MTEKSMGVGAAAQLLAHHAYRLRRSDARRDQVVAEALEVILAQRSRLLTEKFGPPRDFSREVSVARSPERKAP